jgi:hypothetical protein
MNKNLILFGIFIALLVVTYVVQEKRVTEQRVSAQAEIQILKEELKTLEFNTIQAVLKEGKWYSGTTLLSHNSFEPVVKKLKSVSFIRDIQGEWKTFFPHPLAIKVNGVDWTFGELSLDRQSFYLAVGKKIMLADIQGESIELTRNEADIAAIKYNELKSYFQKDLGELKETQLFRFYKNLTAEKVFIESEGRLGFELDFKKNTTTPAPIPGITVHDDIRNKFTTLLTQMNLREEIPFDEKLKVQKLGVIEFIDGDKKIRWELWLRGKAAADSVIIDPDSKRAFTMIGGTLRAYFIQVQDYWDKKIIPLSKFKEFTTLPVDFVQGKKTAKLLIQNREPLGFEVQGYKTQTDNLISFFQVILNLGPYDQADRVSQLSTTERKQVLSEDHLSLHLLDQDLVVWRKAEEVIVVNLTQGFKAHFILSRENISTRFEDMLK